MFFSSAPIRLVMPSTAPLTAALSRLRASDTTASLLRFHDGFEALILEPCVPGHGRDCGCPTALLDTLGCEYQGNSPALPCGQLYGF